MFDSRPKFSGDTDQTEKPSRPVPRSFAGKQTLDGFDNFLTRIGLNTDNTLSESTYDFNLITRNRILLEAAYRGSWMVGSIVDSVADDMTRAGINVTTSEGEENLKELHAEMVRKQVWTSINEGEKWGRLYGGALGVMQIDGQDLSTPLNLDTVGKGQFKGIVVYDRWQLNPVMTPVISSGPMMGLPMFYQIVNNPTSTDPKAATATGQLTVHHSRCFRHIGIKLPFFQAITEMMWGESILERLWDRLVAFDNATMSSASLIDRANLRTVAVDGLREIIAAGGEAQKGLESMFDAIRMLQVNMGLTVIDKNDDFHSDSYTFAGLSDMLLQFAQQLSGAAEIPLVRLLGQSPTGLGGNNDGEIRLYYDSINAKQEAKFRNSIHTLLSVVWRSMYGRPMPKDLEFTFVPLWQMSATDKATIAKTNTETVLGAFEGGLVPKKTAMTELRDSSGDTGIFSNITDEDIEEAEEEPPMPGGGPDPLTQVSEPKKLYPGTAPLEEKEPVKALDAKPSFRNRVTSWFTDTGNFKESDHPRKDDGKFGQGSGGGSSGEKIHEKDKDAAVNFLLGHIKDKDYDSFMDHFDAATEKAEVKEVAPKEASKFKRSHNFTFENDPNSESLNKKGTRGKEVNDPSVVIEFNGEHYVLDGQHRLNRAIRAGKPANVAIIQGDFLKKFGITEKTFEGKKAY